MLLLEINHVKHYVQDRLLLNIESLKVYNHDRIGLVGRNGSGKTSLLEMIAGEVQPDEGDIMRHARLELLPQLKRTDTTKSGGEVTQEYVQQVFDRNAALLLVDEPTTNLDTAHIEWVEKRLRAWPDALIIVSHDRAFLDKLCTTIWEIKESNLTEYKGNYSDYVKQKELEFEQAQLAFEKYEKEKKQLEEAIKKKEVQAQRATKKPKQLSSSEARLKGAKPYFANKQKKLRKTVTAFENRLEKLDKVSKPSELTPVQMDVPNAATFKNQIILRAEHVSGKIGTRTLWDSADFYIRGGEKLAIMGSNGSGKTTLIRKLMNEDAGISISPSVKIGYFAQNLNILNPHQTILENVQSTSKQNETLIRTVLARMHVFNDDVYKQVKQLSGGERVKVALSKVLLSDVNMLVLDEPTNYLDLESLEALENLLTTYEGSVIFVSHDRQFVKNIATSILDIHDQTITWFDGSYQQYEAHQAINRDSSQDEKLLIETKISEILSRLSVEPTEELEEHFQKLLKEKRALEQNQSE